MPSFDLGSGRYQNLLLDSSLLRSSYLAVSLKLLAVGKLAPPTMSESGASELDFLADDEYWECVPIDDSVKSLVTKGKAKKGNKNKHKMKKAKSTKKEKTIQTPMLLVLGGPDFSKCPPDDLIERINKTQFRSLFSHGPSTH